MSRSEKKPDPAQRKKVTSSSSMGFFSRLDEKNQLRLLIFLLGVILTLIAIPKGGLIPDEYQPGDIAVRNVKAPRDLLVADEPLTEKKRQEAEESVAPLYDFDSKLESEVFGRLSLSIDFGRQEAAQALAGEVFHQELEGIFGIPLTDSEATALRKLAGEPELFEALKQSLSGVLDRRIVGNLQLFKAAVERGIVLRDLVSQAETVDRDLTGVIGLGDAQDLVAKGIGSIAGLPKVVRQGLVSIVSNQLRPSLTFNKNETELRKREARDAVAPVLFQVKKGEMIIREGERVSPDQIVKLRALSDAVNDYRTWSTAGGLLLSTIVLLMVTHRFGRSNIRKYRPNNRDLSFLISTFVGLFILIKLAIFVSVALESAFPYIDSTSYYYLFPFAVGAMLVRIVLNSEVALLFTVVTSGLLGVLFGNSLIISMFALAGSLTGAHWVRHCKERATLYRAGLRVSMVNAVLIFGIHLMSGKPLELQLLYKMGFGLAGGLICAVIATGTIPLVEHLFKYTTDIKLLELANMNNPVLRELMVQAPGTYHHSVIVGNLVEAAAEEIGANPLLARVAAYYHDIGKTRKPLYFIENLGGQENRHDKLSPSMSTLILMAHVKDGVELARDARLGQMIIDIIRQHHGTSLIKFFYDKAKTLEDPDVHEVDEKDFRYPGPKPQTREAALIMLADAVEAAGRTLSDPTPARIQGMVQKIINNIFIDGQLNECELTLKDLHHIAKSFNRILAGIFHHRIEYSEPAYKERDRDQSKRKNCEDTNREPAEEPKDRETKTAKSGTEDLKRLGMS